MSTTKASIHDESVDEYGLPEEHAVNHTVFFLRWLIEHDLMSEMFMSEGAEILEKFRSGEARIHDVYDWWDRCLIDDMLSEQGNAFAMKYFDFNHGKYIHDYKATLQGKLLSEFHIKYSEEGYQTMRALIDQRYDDWQKPRKKWWSF
jgi:hypothetical protein